MLSAQFATIPAKFHWQEWCGFFVTDYGDSTSSGFFTLVRCGPQGISNNERGDISPAMLFSAKVFSVTAQSANK